MTEERSVEGGAVGAWLGRAHPVVFSAWAIAAAFSTYFCMYAFRKPFAAASFEGVVELPGLPPLDYKILLIVAQVIGYCLSKFLGIKIISEMTRSRRGLAILGLIGLAELALVGFALTPRPWAAIFLFFNGLPLGMVWGLVFGFLEGRRTSEALGAGLSASYIVASMAVKDVGTWTMQARGVPETWMPAVTGLLFVAPLGVAVWMLTRLPPPTAADEAARVRRAPMSAEQRWAFVRAYTPGLIALTGLYMLLTAYRDFRDNFAAEIWKAVGYAGEPGIMTKVEIPVALGVLLALGLLLLIKNNRRGVLVVHLVMLSGTALIGVATVLFQAGSISPEVWMSLLGLGLYLGYVPYGCVLFDRLIAAVGFVATAGFMIYVTDAFGYLGSVVLVLYKNFGEPTLSWLEFFIGFSYVTAVVCTISFAFSTVYFWRKTRPSPRKELP
jgi:hypothetical protein